MKFGISERCILAASSIMDQAEAYHEQWEADLRSKGWTWGAARDFVALTDPRLCPFGELSDLVRAAFLLESERREGLAPDSDSLLPIPLLADTRDPGVQVQYQAEF